MKKSKLIKACFVALEKLEREDIESHGYDPVTDVYNIQRLELLKAIGVEIESSELIGKSSVLIKRAEDALKEQYELTEDETKVYNVLYAIREIVVSHYDVAPPFIEKMKTKLSEAGLADDKKMLRYIEGMPGKYFKWSRKIYSEIVYLSTDTSPLHREQVVERIRDKFGISTAYTVERFNKDADSYFMNLFERYLIKHYSEVVA